MTDKAKKYLSDIVQAIDFVKEFTKDVKDFDAYQNDQKTKSAVERQLGIIGEAANKFQEVEKNYNLSNIRQIVGFRNRIIHAYDNVDDSIVWAIINNYLPVLRKEAEDGINS